MNHSEEKKWTWTDDYIIRSYEADVNGKTPLTAICKFMQETAYNHANHLEFGYDQLKSNNRFWVLSRLLVKMNRYPVWRERIQVRTWPSGVDGLFAIRDFRFFDEKATVIGAAVTSWLILDSEKHRPQRPDELKERIPLCPKERSLEEQPSKIQKLSHPEQGPFFPVKQSDLDLYRHVNNAKYTEWILDGYPHEIHEEFEPAVFEINFVSEAKMGDEVFIQAEKLESPVSEPAYLHCIRRKEDNREISLARVVWRRKGLAVMD